MHVEMMILAWKRWNERTFKGVKTERYWEGAEPEEKYVVDVFEYLSCLINDSSLFG